MATIVIFELDNDPLNGNDIGVVAGFTVEITDDDGLLEDPDGNGTSQFDVSGVPGLANSDNFQVFETYDGTVNGSSVTFTLIQFSGTQYMFVTSGTVVAGDTIVGPTLGSFTAAPSDYDELPSFVCFAEDTLILTDGRAVAVQELRVGDLVRTMDHGFQPIRWIGSRILGGADLANHPQLRPIRIRAGALGPGLAESDLRVSPQHRMLLRSIVAERMFGTAEILVPAKKLLDLDGIGVERHVSAVIYTHFLFENHQIVFSNGAPTESLFTGPEALKSVSASARREIQRLFPEICRERYAANPARPIPKQGRMVRKLADRIKKNGKCLLEPLT
ncbi:Hint domain-containing protein [Yoonia sp. BS5-3]|uniref:Hint domain-containing protein n=1 Tax=Yoonia phaeophyticola TaxID=3137369 RepID=A0ABZ3IDN3_9RHOB